MIYSSFDSFLITETNVDVLIFELHRDVPVSVHQVKLHFENDLSQKGDQKISFASDLFLGNSYASLLFPFSRDLNHILLFQTESLAKHAPNLDLQLIPSKQLLCVIFHILNRGGNMNDADKITSELHEEEKIKAIINFITKFRIEYDNYKWMPEELLFVYKYLFDIWKKPENLICGLIVLGNIGNSSFHSFLSIGRTDKDFELQEVLLKNFKSKIDFLNEKVRSMALSEKSLNLALYGCLVLAHLESLSDNPKFELWKFFFENNSQFPTIIGFYSNLLKTNKMLLPPPLFKFFEKEKHKYKIDKQLEDSKLLLLFAPSLREFERKLVEKLKVSYFDYEKTKEKIDNEGKNLIEQYMNNFSIKIKDVLDFIQRYDKEIEEPFKTWFKQNQIFCSEIHKLFDSDYKINISDVDSLLSLTTLKYPELLPKLDSRIIEKLLIPLCLERDPEIFSQVVSKDLKSEILIHLLQERIKNIFKNFSQEYIVDKLNLELTALAKYQSLQESKVAQEFMKFFLLHYAYGVTMHRFSSRSIGDILSSSQENYQECQSILDLYDKLITIFNSSIRELILTHIFWFIREEGLIKNNYQPLFYLYKLIAREVNKKNYSKVEHFRKLVSQIGKYFDDLSVDNYQQLFQYQLEVIFILVTQAYSEDIPNTLSHIVKFHSDILSLQVPVFICTELKELNSKPENNGKIELILKTALTKSSTRIDTGNLAFSSLMENFYEVELHKRLIYKFATSNEFVPEEERRKIKKIYEEFYIDFVNMTISQIKNTFPDEFRTLIPPLQEYDPYDSIPCIKCLLKQELISISSIKQFQTEFKSKLENCKKKLHTFISNLDNQPIDVFEQMFPVVQNKSIQHQIEEIKKFLNIQEEKSKDLEQILEVAKKCRKKNDLLIMTNNLIFLQDIINFKSKDLYENLKNNQNIFVKASLKNLSKIVDKISETFNKYFGSSMEAIFSLFCVLSEGRQLLLYVKKKEKKSIEKLLSNIQDFDDDLLTRNNIKLFISLKTFLEDIDQLRDIKSQALLCQKFYTKEHLALVELIIRKKIQAERVDSLIKLIDDDPLLHFEKMKLVLDHSEFLFSVSESKWKITISFFIKGQREDGKLDYLQLQELNQKALLLKNIELQLSEENQNKDNIKVYDDFRELIIQLEKTLAILEKISCLSCPELKKIYRITVENKSIDNFFTENKNLQNLYEMWQGILVKGYTSYPILTYFLPSQFATLENYFTDPTSYPDQQGAIDLLNYAGIKIEKSSFPARYVKPELLEDRVLYLCQYLEKWKIVQPNSSRTGRFFVDCLCSQNIVSSVCQLYNMHNFPFPHASQLLLCQEDTSFERIMNFAYRMLQNPDKYFVFINIEKLPYYMQQNLINILINDNRRTFVTPFGIICRRFQGGFIHYFESRHLLNNRKENTPPLINEILKNALGQDYENCRIIISDGAGYGKTSYIKSEAEKCYLTIKYFSIYGTLSFRKIAYQIQEIIPDLQRSRTALCFQIFQEINLEILNEIFFNIIILRCLEYDSKVLFIPPQTTIFIELANVQNNRLETNFELCNYFSVEEIGILKLYSILDLKNPILSITMEQLKLLNNISETLSPTLIKELLCNSLELTDLNNIPLLQLSIFFKFFSNMIINYQKSSFFAVVQKIDKDNSIHLEIIRMLVKTAKSLMENSLNDVEDNQVFKEENKASESKMEIYQNTKKIEDRKITALCFTEEGNLLPLVYNNNFLPEKVQGLLRTVEENGKKFKLNQDLKKLRQINYSKMKDSDYLEILKGAFNNPAIKADNYVFTNDNFFKMMYIYLRAIAGLPIILMGQTGCGKTSMIKFLCHNVLSCPILILNIHAGCTDEYIIKTVRDEAERAKQEPSKRFWIFFDEFNTNKNIGLIKEIICDRMLLGWEIPRNVVFVAACNPYKVQQRKTIYDKAAGFEQDKDLESELIYKVIPSPSTITKLIWDFGSINTNDEENYIRAILSSAKYPSSIIKDAVCKVVIETHKKLRENNELHIISLRDIRRFLELYNYFSNRTKKEKKSELKKPIALAFMFCYYYRISDEQLRITLSENISKLLYEKSKTGYLIDIVKQESLYFINHMKVPEDIIINDSLSECIYVMIICILIKIPLMVIGKPGCSKSLALKLIKDNFKREKSDDKFFMDYPEIVMFIFQGSDNCHSNGIERLFEKAEEFKESTDVIAVAVIEEIGLCERSPHNPLKVLHQKLEIDNVKVSFVGLSNQRLDAAKMNRTLILNKMLPTRKELIDTATRLYNTRFNAKEPMMEALAEVYYKFQEKTDSFYADVFGCRDYYQLIKQVAFNLYTEKGKNSIIREAIERNFSYFRVGKEYQSFWTEFSSMNSIFPKSGMENKNKIDIIRTSLSKSEKDRTILLVGNFEEISVITQVYLSPEMRKMNLIVGSEYEEDLNSDEYISIILSRIFYCVDKGIPLVLKKLKRIHSHLYDLYNHQKNGPHTCRIPIGAQFHPTCTIHENFHAILIMDEQEFLNEQRPLLNRLEKYHIQLSELMNTQEKKVFEGIKNWINKIDKMKPDLNLSPMNFFVNLDENYNLIRILICRAILKNQNPEKVKENLKLSTIIKADLYKLGTIDLAYALSESEGEKKTKYMELYKKFHSKSLLEQLIECVEKKEGKRKLFFTYTENSENLPKLLDKIAPLMSLIVISNIKKEENINNEIQEFFSSEKKLLLITMDFSTELKHLDHLNAVIRRYQSFPNKKNVCILLFMKTTQIMKERPLIYLQDFEMRMEEDIHFDIEKKLSNLKKNFSNTCQNILDQSFEELLPKFLERVFAKIKHSIVMHPQFDITVLTKKTSLINMVKEKIKDGLKQIKESEEDWSSGRERLKYLHLHTTEQIIAKEKLEDYVFVIFSTIEKYFALNSYLSPDPEMAKEIESIWKIGFHRLNFNWIKPRYSREQSDEKIFLKFPFSMHIYSLIEKVVGNAKIQSIEEKEMKTEQIWNIIQNYVSVSINHDYLLKLLFEDFLKIFAYNNQISIKDEFHLVQAERESTDSSASLPLDAYTNTLNTISFLRKLLIGDFSSVLTAFKDYTMLLFTQKKIYCGILSLIGIASELNISIKEPVSTENFLLSNHKASQITKTELTMENFLEKKGIKLIAGFIEEICPSVEIFNSIRAKNMGYFGLLKMLQMHSFIIVKIAKNIPHWDLLGFLMELARYTMLKYGDPNTLLPIGEKLRAENFTISENDKCVKDFFSQVSTEEIYLAPISRAKFYLFRSLLSKKPSIIRNIFEELENEKACPYYIQLLGDIGNKYILGPTYDNIYNFAEGKFESASNEYLKEIEQYFTEKKLKCNASIMLFYYFIRNDKTKSTIKKRKKLQGVKTIISSYLSKMKDIHQESTYPNLSRFFICIILRVSFEELSRSRDLEGIIKDLTNKGILNDSPLCATLRLYMFKLLKGEKSTFEKIQNIMDKKMCLNNLKLEPFPRAIPNDDISYKKFLEFSSLLRHLKLVGFSHDTSAIAELEEGLRTATSEGYPTLLALCLSFINEFYSENFFSPNSEQSRSINTFLIKRKEYLENSLSPILYKFLVELNVNFLDSSKLLSYHHLLNDKINEFPILQIIIVYIISIFCSSKDLKNPFTTCFYQSGKLLSSTESSENNTFVQIQSSYLFGKRDTNILTPEKGYREFRPEEDPTNYKCRSLSFISYRIMSLILHTILYYLHFSKIISLPLSSDSDEIYLINHIETNFDCIKFLVKLERPNFYEWIYQVLSEFGKFLPSLHPEGFAQNECDRNKFEEEVENKIINPSFDSRKTVIEDYPLITEKIAKDLITGEELLNEKKVDPRFFMGDYFNTLKTGSIKDLENFMNYGIRRISSPAISTMLEHKEINVASIKNLLPVARLTNYFLENYNYKITHNKVEEIHISYKEQDKLRELMDSFTNAWKEAEFLNKPEILYKSEAVKNNVDFSSNELKNYLIDNKTQAGKLLVGAMAELAQKQNEILQLFSIKLQESLKLEKNSSLYGIFKLRKIPLQKISEDDLIISNTDISQELSTMIYYPPFKQHDNLYIDIDTLENWAFKLLLDKKYLDCDKIEEIQYLDDISPTALPLEQLRELDLKDELKEKDKIEIEEICTNLIDKNELEKIKEILNTLGCIMCYVSSSSPTPSKTTLIKSFCYNQFSGKSSFLNFVNEYPKFSSLTIDKLVDLYETVELKFFEYFQKILPFQFREDIDSDTQRNLEAFFDAYPVNRDSLLENFSIALRRIVVRAQDELRDGNGKLEDLLYHEEFWKPEIRAEILMTRPKFPKEILLKHIDNVYYEVCRLKDHISEFHESEVSSSIKSSILTDKCKSESSEELW